MSFLGEVYEVVYYLLRNIIATEYNKYNYKGEPKNVYGAF
jgi:hypothetical protein